jgi:hypothetical protein
VGVGGGRQGGRQERMNAMACGSCVFNSALLVVPLPLTELKKKEGEKEDKGGEERRSPHSQFRPRIVLTP